MDEEDSERMLRFPEQRPRLLYRVRDFMEMTQLPKATAYELVRCGEVKSIRVGNTIRIPADAITTWLEEKQAA